MTEYRVLRDSLISQENIDEATKKILDMHEKPVTITSQSVKSVDLDDQAIRAIVREELEALKAEVVEKVINDLGTEMERQLRGHHEC